MKATARVSYLGVFRPGEALVDVFRAGRLSDVLDFTRFAASVDDSLLRARAFMRLGFPADALEASNVDVSHVPNLSKAERALIRALAHGRLGRFAEASEELTNARAYGFGLPLRALEADVDLAAAVLAFMSGDTATAKALLRSPSAFESAHARFGRVQTPLWDEHHVAARRFELEGAVAAREGNAPHQSAAYAKALDRACSVDPPDLWLIGNIAATYAMVLREYHDAAAMQALQAKVVGLAWTPDLATFRFHIVRAGGLSAALAGNAVAAFAQYRESAKIAPTAAFRVAAMTDRIFLSRELGTISGDFLLDELHEVAEYASRVNWDASSGEEYVSLLLLAQVFAAAEPSTAAAYFERYKKLHARSNRDAIGRGDPRRTAAELAVAGSIAKARGERFAAIAALEQACTTYADLGCDWRAATAAVELLELDPTAPARTIAARVAAAAPASWIARRLRQIG